MIATCIRVGASAPTHFLRSFLTPKCTSKAHQEFTCLGAYYQNRKFTESKWCEACLAAFRSSTEEQS